MRETRKKYKKRVFTKKQYNSGDGMLTGVWGPSLWHFLHTMSFNYPVSPTKHDKLHYKNFILNLQYILPCKYCRINLKKNFKTYPLKQYHFKNRESFSRYIYNLHEIINKMLGKKSALTYSDVRERYEHFRSRCMRKKPKIFNFNKTRKVKETGCIESLYGNKSKCIIKIVPDTKKCKTLTIDKKCMKRKI
jgi:hypothetical protein|tara:strand:- start:1828 stop:2400 length:573 start_codon:yes stop_codon:yes gene_type:complete